MKKLEIWVASKQGPGFRIWQNRCMAYVRSVSARLRPMSPFVRPRLTQAARLAPSRPAPGTSTGLADASYGSICQCGSQAGTDQTSGPVTRCRCLRARMHACTALLHASGWSGQPSASGRHASVLLVMHGCLDGRWQRGQRRMQALPFPRPLLLAAAAGQCGARASVASCKWRCPWLVVLG